MAKPPAKPAPKVAAPAVVDDKAAKAQAFKDKMAAGRAAKAAEKAAAQADTPAKVDAKAPAVVKPAAVKKAAKETTAITETNQEEPSLYDHLLDAARSKDSKFANPHAKETEQAFYKRLIDVVVETTEEVWNSLPEAAQIWTNEAGEAIEKGKPIKVLEGYASRAGVSIAADAGKPEKGAGLKRYREEQAALKASGAVIPPKEKKAKQPKADKPPGRVDSIRRFIIDNPTATAAQVQAHLIEIGVGETKAATININMQWTKAAIADIKAAGHWK